VAATLLLLGAQVIAEYEGIETGEAEKPPVPMCREGVGISGAAAASWSRPAFRRISWPMARRMHANSAW
jgi:hypothetical protein